MPVFIKTTAERKGEKKNVEKNKKRKVVEDNNVHRVHHHFSNIKKNIYNN